MKALKVWILQTGEPLHCDDGSSSPMRAINLANELASRGHSITLISSRFHHQEKHHRVNVITPFLAAENIEIHLLRSFGYKKNIGISRLYDHFTLSLSLLWFLLRRFPDYPNLVFIGYPPIETSFLAILWGQIFRVPTILDVKDLWPDMFLDAFNPTFRPFVKLLFFPYFMFSRYCFKKSTYLSSMSSAYLSHISSRVNRKLGKFDSVNPLTRKKRYLADDVLTGCSDYWKQLGVYDKNIPRFVFIGTFMTVFDFYPIAAAAKLFYQNNIHAQFVICGDGEMSEHVINLFSHIPNCILPGWISFEHKAFLYNISTISFIPYKNIDNYLFNFPNKVVDSLSYSVPIVTPLRGNLLSMINKYEIGWYYDERIENSLYSLLVYLTENPDLVSGFATNCKRIYSKQFSYESVYPRLCNTIEQVATSY